MKKSLHILFLVIFVALSASAQRVGFEISFKASCPADVSKVYVQPLNEKGDAKAIPLRMKGEAYSGKVPLSATGFYEVVMVINDGQWMMTVFTPETKKVELSIDFDCKAVAENSSADNRALSAFNAVASANNRKLWLESGLSDDALRALVEEYFVVTDSIAEVLKPSEPVMKYIRAWAYTGAQNLYSSIPRAQGRSRKDIPFSEEDVLPPATDVLDNEYAALQMSAMQSVFSDISANVGLGLDGMLEVLYDGYKCDAVRARVADMAVKRFLARYSYAEDFDGGLEYLKDVVAYFNLPTSYVDEYMKHKAALLGADFPSDVVLLNADGDEVDFSAFKGKYVYIDLWASWCAPCCKEIPHLQAIEKEFKDSDVVFVSISTDVDTDAWKARMQEYDMHGNQLIDRDNNLTQLLNVGGIPFFVVYDKEGKLHTYGAMRPSSGESLKQFLRSLE